MNSDIFNILLRSLELKARATARCHISSLCRKSGVYFSTAKRGFGFFELELATWKAATSRSTPDYITKQWSHLLEPRLDFRSHADISLQVEFFYHEFHAEMISNDAIQSKLSRFGNPIFLTREIFYNCVSGFDFLWLFRNNSELATRRISALIDSFQMSGSASLFRLFNI